MAQMVSGPVGNPDLPMIFQSLCTEATAAEARLFLEASNDDLEVRRG